MKAQPSLLAFVGIIAAGAIAAGDENWDDRFGPLGILGGAGLPACFYRVSTRIPRWDESD